MSSVRDVHYDLDDIAKEYVKLVLMVGEHDSDYVDAYYGPSDWREEVTKAGKKPLTGLKTLGKDLSGRCAASATGGLAEIERLRHEYLARQLEAVVSRIEMLEGKKLTFDEEAKALYDAAPPHLPEEHFARLIRELSGALPGSGDVPARYEEFRKHFVIPVDRLDAVFDAAIQECRARTKMHIPLPRDENFSVEYVTNKPWSGYNWYKGGNYSLIQVNTDLPIYIDRAIDLAAHEGYPGHHIYNALLEEHLVRQRNWPEFSVYALFSPQSLIAEGTANFGIEVALPGEERVRFERNILFPLAGLDASRVEHYYRVQDLVNKLAYAGNEAARHYLDGAWSRDQAAEWLVSYALMSPERAMQRTRFFDAYRSYVINYNLGKDLVQKYIESRGGTAEHPVKRWDEFRELISSPRLPSGLRVAQDS